MKKAFLTAAVITIVYILFCILLWEFTARSFEGIDERRKLSDYIFEIFVNYITMAGVILIAVTLYEQVRLNKITEQQIEIANRPIVSIRAEKGDTAIDTMTMKVICENIGPSVYYEAGLYCYDQNKYLKSTFYPSSRFFSSHGEIEFSFIFEGDPQALLFAGQQVKVVFRSLDSKIYHFIFYFDLLGKARILGMEKVNMSTK